MLLEEADSKPSKNWFPQVDSDVFETTALKVTWEVCTVFLSVLDKKEILVQRSPVKIWPAVVGIMFLLQFYAWSHKMVISTLT